MIVNIKCLSVYLILFGKLSVSYCQVTYYVSSSGNDTNDGRSSASPFRTVEKVNDLSLLPGDQILFRRNDVFPGSLQLNQSGSSAKPIVINAYGSGEKPVLSGSVSLGSWIKVGEHIWQSSCPACGDRVTGLYQDNKVLPLGRYPNLNAAKGFMTVRSHVSKTQLTSQQRLATDWTGAEAVFRSTVSMLNRALIIGQNSSSLRLGNLADYEVSDNWGYFIQNHPATLDQMGEWYYNPANKTIQLYDNQTDPNTHKITAAAFDQAIRISDASFINVRNVQITQTLFTGLLIINSSNLIVANTDITQSGEDAIRIQGTGQQILLENNLIEDANNNGVTITSYRDITFRGNTVRRIGLTPGRGKSGDNSYVGFQSASTANTLIEDNIFEDIGYNALTFSASTTVQRNKISNFSLTKSDGNGLSTWTDNTQSLTDIHLLSNVIHNGAGAREGVPSGIHTKASGIYLRDCSTNIEVTGNSVYDCVGYGLALRGSSNTRVTGNTAYNNEAGQLFISSSDVSEPRTNLIQGNTFVSRLPKQYTVNYESNSTDRSDYGQFDNNVYARPFDDELKFFVTTGSRGKNISLAQWQTRYGKDQTSSNSPLTYAAGDPDDYIKFISNPTAEAKQIDLEGTYRDTRNKVYTGKVPVAAFSSVVLLKDVKLSMPLREADNPTDTVAGLDYSYYKNEWTTLPDFNTVTVQKAGTNKTPSLSLRNRDVGADLIYTGYINVPSDGIYTFSIRSDNSSKLLIGSTEVVSNESSHGEQERSGSIGLKTGLHALTIGYGKGGQASTVSYSGPDLVRQVIPATALWRVNTNGNENEPDAEQLMSVYPVPARESVSIRYYAKEAGSAIIQLVTPAAQRVFQQQYQVIQGENIIKVAVDELHRGNYILTLTQDSHRLSRKVLLTE